MDKILDNIVTSSHDLKISDRSQIHMTGIKRIVSFDNEEFLMDSSLGTLLLKGEGLEIIRLDTHDGNVSIKGKINSIAYTDGKKGENDSLLSKLFK
ncbi:MAG: sporulation protein YabP [Bacilli bacterium]